MKPNRPKIESTPVAPETKDTGVNQLVELEARHRLEREKILKGAVAARNIIIEQTAEELSKVNPVSRQDIEPDLTS